MYFRIALTAMCHFPLTYRAFIIDNHRNQQGGRPFIVVLTVKEVRSNGVSHQHVG